MKAIINLVLCSITILLLSACGDKYMHDSSKKIDANTWAYKDTLDYAFSIKDTMKIYNLYLEVSHGEAYPFQNLYVMTHTQFPNKMRVAQQLNIDLAEKSGQWRGKKSGGTWTHRVDLQEGAYFSQVGDYSLTLAQHMRKDSLPALENIRFIVEETPQSRDKVDIKKGQRPQETQKKYIVQ